MREFSFYGKPELTNFFFFLYPRILVLRKTRIGEIFFSCFSFYARILFSWKTRIREFFLFFSLSENSRFEENQNRRISFFLFFFFYARILVLWTNKIGEFFFFLYPGILVLRKTRIGEFFFFFFLMRELSFCGKPESEDFFFFF